MKKILEIFGWLVAIFGFLMIVWFIIMCIMLATYDDCREQEFNPPRCEKYKNF